MTQQTSPDEFEAEQTLLDAQWVTLRDAQAGLSAAFQELRGRTDDLTTRRLDVLTDEQILADEEIRRWLCAVGATHTGANQRLHSLADVSPLLIHHVDPRDEFYPLPVPTVMLECDSDVELWATTIEEWFKVWSLGRQDISIDVLESTLSAYSSYSLVYTPGGAVVAELFCNSMSLSKAFDGSLVAVLRFIAKHHPYNGGYAETDDEWGER